MILSSTPRQPGSQFWGTGEDLAGLREIMDPVGARLLIASLGYRLFGNRYDYSLVEFRGLNLPVTLTDRYSMERITVTPYWHLMSVDGRGE